MRLTVAMTYKCILLPLIIFLACSGLALAQTEVIENFAPITEDFCWMKECKTRLPDSELTTTMFALITIAILFQWVADST